MPRAGKHEGGRVAGVSASSMASVESDSATRWMRPAFIRSAGTAQTFASRSISPQVAPQHFAGQGGREDGEAQRRR